MPRKASLSVNIRTSARGVLPCVAGMDGDCVVVFLTHGTEYSIELGNHETDGRRADVQLTIDGKLTGTYRLNAGRKCVVERPTDDSKMRKFTFYAVESKEARAGNVSETNPHLGVVYVEAFFERDNAVISGGMVEPQGVDEGDEPNGSGVDKNECRLDANCRRRRHRELESDANNFALCGANRRVGDARSDGAGANDEDVECDGTVMTPRSEFAVTRHCGRTCASDGASGRSADETDSSLVSRSGCSGGLGGTALGSDSSQRFVSVARLQYDPLRTVYIRLLLRTPPPVAERAAVVPL